MWVFMDLKAIFAADSFAVSLPLAASAETVNLVDGGTYDITEDTLGVLHQYSALIDAENVNNFEGRDLSFTFDNELQTAISLEVSTTNDIIPVDSATGGGVTAGFGSQAVVLPDDGSVNFDYVMGVGEEVTFYVRLGDEIIPNYKLDVLVIPTPVPVPAAGFLLLGGLGGLAMMRRRKTS